MVTKIVDSPTQILERIRTGESVAAIMADNPVTNSRVHQIVRMLTGKTITEVREERGMMATSSKFGPFQREDVERALELYLAGQSARGAAATQAVSLDALRTLADERGIVITKSTLRTPEQIADVLTRYGRGETCEEIGAVYGCSEATVRRLLVREGRERRPCAPRRRLS